MSRDDSAGGADIGRRPGAFDADHPGREFVVDADLTAADHPRRIVRDVAAERRVARGRGLVESIVRANQRRHGRRNRGRSNRKARGDRRPEEPGRRHGQIGGMRERRHATAANANASNPGPTDLIRHPPLGTRLSVRPNTMVLRAPDSAKKQQPTGNQWAGDGRQARSRGHWAPLPPLRIANSFSGTCSPRRAGSGWRRI